MMEAKKITVEALDHVAGGTVEQTKEIWNAIRKTQRTIGDVAGFLTDVGNEIPVARKLDNCLIAHGCEHILDRQFRINANLSVGWGGTGFRETENTYTMDGKAISHAQALNFITQNKI